jgi:hypothetical protein
MVSLVVLFALLIMARPASAREGTRVSSRPNKICVARVANGSGKPLPVELLQSELISKLKQANVNPLAAPTSTLLASSLALSPPNRGAFHALGCDYMLLTEVAGPVPGKATTRGQTTPLPVDSPPSSLVINFALFQRGGALSSAGHVKASGKDTRQAIRAAASDLSARVLSAVTSGRKK